MSGRYNSLMQPGKRRTIATRLLVYIILISLIFTFVDTALQLYSEYHVELNQIEEQIRDINDSYNKSISKTAWELDKVGAALIVEGVLKARNIKYLSIKTERGDILAEAGSKPAPIKVSRIFPLKYQQHGTTHVVGTFEVVAGLEDLYNRLKKKLLIILATQAVRIFLVSACILILFHQLVTRHLASMSRYAKQLNLDHLDTPLTLDRFSRGLNNPDELDRVVSAINDMRLGLISDISKRKQAENQLKETNEKYFALLQANPDPVIVYDVDGRTLFLNPAFTRVFGWTLEELQGQPFEIIPNGGASEEPATAEELFGKADQIHMETTRQTKDGRVLDIAVSAANYNNSAGRRVGLIANLKDITEQKRLEMQLRQSQKMEAIGTLASGVAHDFNNILQVISGNTQLILGHAELDPGIKKFAAQIEGAAERATSLVQRLLTSSRNVEPELQPLDLRQELPQTVEMLSRMIPRMIEIKTNIADDLNLIRADGAQLNQVLINLGTNARDAMPDGGKLVFEAVNKSLDDEFCSLNIGAVPGDYVELTISDTGVGMDGDVLKNIFTPFFTTKEVGKGTGLGLAVAYGIIKNHKGYIICDSAPGAGAVFKIYWPVVHYDDVKTRSDDDQPDMSGGGNELILLVDDEESIIEIAREFLLEFGYSIISANSGEEALRIYAERGREINLVLMDLGMPGIGGHKALVELIKTDPAARIIIASGYADEDNIKEAMKAGAAGFISKPYKLKNMYDKVREVLED